MTARIIKKYPNRRLYDEANSRYVNFGELKDLLLTGENFKVIVDKTGEEFTFWGNGDFLYIGKNNRSQGKWKCKGSNNFEVITDWGGTKYYYRSETGQWALTPNAPALEENFIKKIVTKHLRSKL